MVPLRFISESLGADVGWEQTTKTVSITSDTPKTPPPSDGKIEPLELKPTNIRVEYHTGSKVLEVWADYENKQLKPEYEKVFAVIKNDKGFFPYDVDESTNYTLLSYRTDIERAGRYYRDFNLDSYLPLEPGNYYVGVKYWGKDKVFHEVWTDPIVDGKAQKFINLAPKVDKEHSASTFWEDRSTWLHPLKGMHTANPNEGRKLGADRSNGRKHAGVDFLAEEGTKVYSMTDGEVIAIEWDFYSNTNSQPGEAYFRTHAVVVRNNDGTIFRYGEVIPSVKVGGPIKRGDIIGTVAYQPGSKMLHLETYMGTVAGALTQRSNSQYLYVESKNYQRRADLIDSLGANTLPNT